MVHIHSINHVVHSDTNEVRGMIDEFTLWFRVSKNISLSDSADAFVCAALLVAMSKGEDLQVQRDNLVSSKLLKGLRQLQIVYKCWYPQLRIIDILCEQSSHSKTNPGVASFFSGGVDSLYTLYTRRDEITNLIFVHGIDIKLDNPKLFEEVYAQNLAFAQSVNKELVCVTSNIKDFCDHHKIRWASKYCASGLASIAHVIGMQTVYFPASQPIENQYPDGTTPITDHLYSSEGVDILYEGAVIRYLKLQYISQYDEAMNLIRVCYKSTSYNCGQCEKCLRTRIILRALNIKCPTLPRLNNLKEINSWRIRSENDFYIFKNLLRAANSAGDKKLYWYLKRLFYREKIYYWLINFDKNCINGRIRKRYNSFKQDVIK